MSVSLETVLALGLMSGLTMACESSDPATGDDAGAGGAGGAPAGGDPGGGGGDGGNVVENDAGPEPDADPCEGRPVQTWCLDADGDGHGDADASQETCDTPADHVTACDDCDDTNDEVLPGGTEVCNGADDNCDGSPDEGLGIGDACMAGIGACEAAGVTACLPNGEVGCDATPLAPTAETCNDLDDDCNGVVDDSGASETCNGVDDDCDDAVDEDLGVGDACTAGAGACRAEGVNACDVGNGQVVCSAVAGLPADETCDSLDNDCDGEVDNSPAGCACEDGTTVPCGSDVGECSLGVQTCVDGALGACEGETEAGAEACDGLDNDCDAAVDNREGAACECLDGTTRACGSDVGECAAGTQTCVDGAFGACNDTAPAGESCNGLDDDCNGVEDDRQGDACECNDGATQGCGTDVGECVQGTQTCVSGHFAACAGATEAVVESCDALDNDCNGQVDDRQGAVCECVTGISQPCGSNVGACVQGTAACVDGALAECLGATGPSEEVFDREDNNCDGEVDNLVCGPEPDDFPAAPEFAGCLSQDLTFHAFDGANISTIARTQAFDQIGDLLWRANAPDAAAFANARMIYAVAEGIDSRVQRRFDSHFQASVPANTNCRTAGVPAMFPDYCVGPARILPLVVAAFDAGMAGTDPDINAAKIEAALLWFFYTSVYKESTTCATAIVDCDSSHAYYNAATPRAMPAGLARYVSAASPHAHDQIFNGTLAAHCWRELDPGATAMNLVLQAQATEQLDVALDYGAAHIMTERLHAWEAANGVEKAAQWAFIQIWGLALDRAVRVRDAAVADALVATFAGNGAGATAADVEDALFPLIPCP